MEEPDVESIPASQRPETRSEKLAFYAGSALIFLIICYLICTKS